MFEKAAVAPADLRKDVEEWPLLALADAEVVLPARSGHLRDELVDLFEIAERGPFRVRGRLQPPPKKFRSTVLKPHIVDGSHVLQIPGVVTYSIERSRKKALVLWVLGGCAWYALSPSAAYTPVFERLLEKANLWLFLRDMYAGPLRGAVPKDRAAAVADVYKEYAEYEPSCRTARAAGKLFHRHHRFLIFEMRRQAEETGVWEQTPLWQEFELSYQDVCDGARAALDRPPPKSKTTSRSRSRAPPETPPPEPPVEEQPDGDEPAASQQSAAGSQASLEDQILVDDSTPSTPSSSSSSDDERGGGGGPGMRTRSSKGKSTLRPKRVKTIPADEPEEGDTDPPEPADAAYLDSPTITRLTRSRQPLALPTPPIPASVASLASTPEPPPPLPAKPSRARAVAAEDGGEAAVGNTPGGRHWKCTLGGGAGLGCGHVVYNARTREGRREIAEHYRAHGEVVENAVAAIAGEAEEGRQVGNLLAKMESMRQKMQETRPGVLGVGVGE